MATLGFDGVEIEISWEDYGSLCLAAQAPGAGDAIESLRQYDCVSCGVRTYICSDCDRGQRYCNGDCSARARARNTREARARYQRSALGRRNNAFRQKRWRVRRAHARVRFTVTDQGSPSSTTLREVQCAPSPREESNDRVLPEPSPTSDLPIDTSPRTLIEEHECAFCQSVRTCFVRLDWLRRGPPRGRALRHRRR